MPSRTWIAGALAGLLIGSGLSPASASAAAPGAPAAAQPASARPAAGARVITLVTGDVVSLVPAGDGRYAATVRPGAGREGISFRTVETEGGVRVLPSDAVPLVADGRVDAELFDVEHLLAEGYGDADTDTLPLIVQSAAGLRTAGATALASLGAVAVRARKDSLPEFWRSRTSSGARSAAAGRIWLDGRVRATLDRSTVQIGAPTAWRAGLDGSGVKVAVLDTGVDAGHPDLAGRIAEARDFSGTADTVDHFGHGTHVASIAAGRKGVAPGARLLVGKVLDDTGSGYESSIIEGMQWAVDRGAKVVNMSLGGDATDGTDPMSAAVDELSAASGALFVVAAGNEGADYTVGTPGAATSALTVGAVDRDDTLAEFSSRGPRAGDLGLKPEITAPGVGIVAARAAGTTMGDPVDSLYTAASGTSMATPHVAGAAAILAQQHPGWSGPRLKDSLVSTARTAPGADVFGQGAGRVDLARATTQAVAATGVADFGIHDVGGAAVTRTVTYATDGAAPVTLSLRASMPGVTAGAASVTVPAGGTASVPLKLDLGTARGLVNGWLTATGPGGVLVTTALAGTVDPPHHSVTFTAVGRTGAPVDVPVLQMFGDDRRFDVLSYLLDGSARTYEVAAGDYLVDASISDGGPLHHQDTLITIPELRVDRDLTVVLDARTARPIRIETPRPAEQQTVLSYYVHRVTGSGRSIANGFMDFSDVESVNVTPTAPLRAGSYEFSSRWQLVAPIARAAVPGVGTFDADLLPASAAYDGVRHFELRSTPSRAKAVVLDCTADCDEYEQVRAAASAGAAVALVVRGADRSAWSPWSPDGEERLPIPALAIPYDIGQRLLARATRPGATVDLTLTTSSPYLYDVLQVSSGRVPAQIVHRVTAANSQRITNRYAFNGGFDWVREQRFGWRPWQTYAWNDTQRAVRTPSVRQEWVSVGDSIWQHQVHHAYPWNDLGASLDGGMADDPVSYRRAGRSADEVWNSPVVRPYGTGSNRTADVLHLRIADYVDSTDRHRTIDQADQASARLYRDGTLISTTRNAWQDVTVPPGDAAYRLVLSTARGGTDWQFGTATTTEWAFRSAHAGALPLLQISYDAPVDLNGTATTRAHRLGVTVPGARTVTVETSADEGATWRPGTLVPSGRPGATVSLRVTAVDRAGNTVRQTVLRAYGRS